MFYNFVYNRKKRKRYSRYYADFYANRSKNKSVFVDCVSSTRILILHCWLSWLFIVFAAFFLFQTANLSLSLSLSRFVVKQLQTKEENVSWFLIYYRFPFLFFPHIALYNFENNFFKKRQKGWEWMNEWIKSEKRMKKTRRRRKKGRIQEGEKRVKKKKNERGRGTGREEMLKGKTKKKNRGGGGGERNSERYGRRRRRRRRKNFKLGWESVDISKEEMRWGERNEGREWNTWEEEDEEEEKEVLKDVRRS